MTNTSAIILAAGKGTRMNSGDKNKVTLEIGGQPMVRRTVINAQNAGMEQIIVVVGFAGDSVKDALKGLEVDFAHQKEQLGTGHAVKVALPHLSNDAENIFVFYGDDTSYSPAILNSLHASHINEGTDLSFLTVAVDNPAGLGRIVRENGNLKAIVEEKDATEEEKRIKEINPGCFLFKKDFLLENINKIQKNQLKGEFYITDLIKIAIEGEAKVQAINNTELKWRGINTKDELEEAQSLI